jgi:putative ABC transport system permease protein
LTLIIGAAAEPTSLAPLVRREWRAMAPAVPLGPISTMEQIRAASVAQPRFMMLLLVGASGLAFAIAVVGLYGVVAYRVAQRRKEFGVRVALGAVEGDITRLVLREAVVITIAGVAVGVPAALAFARLLRGFLYDVSATDPALLIFVPACLAVVATLAAYLPARRAAHLDPVTALRAE